MLADMRAYASESMPLVVVSFGSSGRAFGGEPGVECNRVQSTPAEPFCIRSTSDRLRSNRRAAQAGDGVLTGRWRDEFLSVPFASNPAILR
jgi:hypothetical protein